MDENLCVILNSLFSKISPKVANAEFFRETLNLPGFCGHVVFVLEEIENSKNPLWWEEKSLLMFFDELYKAGIVTLPHDPVERIRWIALLCIAAAKAKDYSYGNVLITPDYLPDDMVEMYERVYGSDVIEEVILIREELREKGWEATFPK